MRTASKHPANTAELSGLLFARLTVLGSAGASKGKRRWACKCECGTVVTVPTEKLRSGHTKSCGCLKRELCAARCRARRKAVRQPRHPLYAARNQMLQRCYNKRNPAYAEYGGRGIAVCDRWRFGDGEKSGLCCFAEDMGSRPSSTHSLDRKDNDDGYSPGNCRWATRAEQARNRRSNRLVLVSGRRVSLAEACEVLRLDYALVANRITRGRPFDAARLGAEIGGTP